MSPPLHASHPHQILRVQSVALDASQPFVGAHSTAPPSPAFKQASNLVSAGGFSCSEQPSVRVVGMKRVVRWGFTSCCRPGDKAG